MIARELGWGSRARMLEGLSAHELVWWKALYSVEGEERDEAAREAARERERAARQRPRVRRGRR